MSNSEAEAGKLSVSEYLSQYTSVSTKKTYLSAMRMFFRTIKPKLKNEDLDKFSVEYLSNNPDVRSDLIKFRDILLDSPPKTMTLYLVTITNYLNENGISLTDKLKASLRGQSSEAISEEYIPKNEDLERILAYLPLIGRSITIFLSSSGMRIGETLKLKITNLDLSRTPVRVSIPASITKTKKKRLTFISSEAKKIIEEWLIFRPQWLKTTEARANSQIMNQDRLFPISSKAFDKLWLRAVDKAKLKTLDVQTGRLTCRPHNLRKFFRTRGGWMNPDIPEALMGHKAGLNAIYARFDQAEKVLEDGYLAAEANLSIFESSKNILELKNTVEKQGGDITKLITDLSLRNFNLQTQVKGIEADIPKMIEYVNKPYVELIQSLQDRLKELETEVEEWRKYDETQHPSDIEWKPVTPEMRADFIRKRDEARKKLKDTP